MISIFVGTDQYSVEIQMLVFKKALDETVYVGYGSEAVVVTRR